MENFIFLLFLIMISFSEIIASDRLTGKNFTTRSEVIAKNGMAATSQPLATQIALDKDGNIWFTEMGKYFKGKYNNKIGLLIP